MLAELVAASGHQLRVGLVAEPGLVRGLPDTLADRSLRRHRRSIIQAASRRGATNVRVFGSLARGSDIETSDVDLPCRSR